ncbi:hypothetical protein CDL15_Pgr004027 [Punica granatum]|uniref:RBR-type E3 ubiquitin transferase n=1 Tax=Punica granatum TaxID=22663 RepID=A0A218XFM6_PUNGR|nr:hypothetical protein CDL15_Pgr004027 [Punica granatum]
MSEIKKPFRNGGFLSELEVDIQALVEGLDAALSSNLKRVTFFISQRTHNYVLDLKPHGDEKIQALINQADLLRKMFNCCELHLFLGLNDNRCFKLARRAIISQLSWSEKTPTGKKRKETCIKCFEGTVVLQMYSVDGCLHRFCFSCMRKHIQEKLLTGMVVNCPHDGCTVQLIANSCKKFLLLNLVSLMSQPMEEAAIPIEERIYCPYPRCSTLMSKRDVLKCTKESFARAQGCRKCIGCQLYFCIDCEVPWHHNMSCSDYRRSNPNTVKSLAREKMWQQCKKCKIMVELVDGCYHISCWCGYEFCYKCRAVWKKRKPTCNCGDKRNNTRQ